MTPPIIFFFFVRGSSFFMVIFAVGIIFKLTIILSTFSFVVTLSYADFFITDVVLNIVAFIFTIVTVIVVISIILLIFTVFLIVLIVLVVIVVNKIIIIIIFIFIFIFIFGKLFPPCITINNCILYRNPVT